MLYVFTYIAIVFVLQALLVYKGSTDDTKALFTISWFWIISIPFISLVILFDKLGWRLDIESNNKIFGFRKPTNKKVKGFALTLFWNEFQIYKNIEPSVH
jgi:hypothetical protein